MKRRRLISGAAVAGGLAALAACGRGSQDGSGATSHGDATAAPTGTGPAAPQSSMSDPTEVPSWRSVEDIPVVPDSPSRGLAPTTPSGEDTTVEGLTVTAPTGSVVKETTNSAGRPATKIEMPGAGDGIPSMLVSRVPSFGRSLVEETYAQESLLDAESEKHSYVRRTQETWPGAEDAYVITWTGTLVKDDGSQQLLDALGFWIGDGPDSGWSLIATAPQGEMEGSPLWDTVFSARITG